MHRREELEGQKRQKVIKLIKNPIDESFLDMHTAFGPSDLAYLVMYTKGVDNLLYFYAEGKITEIKVDDLYSLFQDVKPGWARNATPAQYDIMKEKSEALSSFLSDPPEDSHGDESGSNYKFN